MVLDMGRFASFLHGYGLIMGSITVAGVRPSLAEHV